MATQPRWLHRSRLGRWLSEWGATLVVLGVMAPRYVKTMPPGVTSLQVSGWTDSAALQVVGSYWGIAHSPGYPLYTVLANLFVRLVGLFAPATEPAWRVSLFSVCLSLIALFLVAAIAKQLGASSLLSAAAAAILGTTAVSWRLSITAEVYGLNLVLVLLGIWLAFDWLGSDRGRRSLVPLGLTCGALAVHHRTGLFLVLAVVPWLLLNRKGTLRTRVHSLLLVIATALPLLAFYAYLPLAARLNHGYTRFYADAAKPEVWLSMIQSREWWPLVHWPATLAEFAQAAGRVASTQAQEMGGALLALVGLAGLGLNGKRSLLLIALAAGFAFFGILYSTIDVGTMLQPLTALLSLGCAVAAQRAVEWIRRVARPRWFWRLAGALLTLALLIGPAKAVLRPPVDLSGDTVGLDLVDNLRIMAQDDVPVGFVAQHDTPMAAAQYARARYALDDLEPIPEYVPLDVLLERWQEGRTLYVSSEVLKMELSSPLSAAISEQRLLVAPTYYPDVSLLLPLDGLPSLTRPPQHAVTDRSQGSLQLVGYDQRWIQKRSGIYLRLTLYWQSRSTAPDHVLLRLRPLGSLSPVLETYERQDLLNGALQPSRLLPGDTLRDSYELRLSAAPSSSAQPEIEITCQVLNTASAQPFVVTIPVDPFPSEGFH